MSHRSVKKVMRILNKATVLAVVFTGGFSACSPRIYKAPHLGAEYRFDEGLKPEKKSQHLFEKDMNTYLEKRGMKNPAARNAQAATVSKKDTAQSQAPVTGSHRVDTLTMSGSQENRELSDSSHNDPH